MKKRRIIKKILIIIVSLIFLLSAYAMLSSNQIEIDLLTELNLLDYRIALGFINLIIVVSLWIKKTRQIGILVATAYLGGAIASELSIGDSGLIPGVIILTLWIIHKLDSWSCSCGTCATCAPNSIPTTTHTFQ
jgi:hypothetical protein